MPKSDYHRAVDMIQAALRPWLRERGFRCRGRNFNRATDDGLTQVIGIQMGPYDPPGTIEIPGFRENLHGWFTVNLGVYVPEAALYHYGGAATWVVEARCAIRARLDQVSGADCGLWWRADAHPDVIEDIRERLRIAGLPWLDGFASRERILTEFDGLEQSRWCNTPRIVNAIIHAARGDAAAARTLLAAQARDAEERNPLHATRVREIAVKLGLDALDVSAKPYGPG